MRIANGLSKFALIGAMLCCAGVNLAHAQGALPGGPGGPMPPPAKTYEVQVQLFAGASVYKAHPTGSTMHHGVGFIAPFGYAEYYCGHNFAEEKDFPLTPWEAGLFNTLTGRADALFCLYSTKDGTFYVRDSVAGTVYQDKDDAGLGASRNMMINLVVGGTGPYAGATGLWTGYTEGRGVMSSPVPGSHLPQVLMKVMNGYVKIPIAR